MRLDCKSVVVLSIRIAKGLGEAHRGSEVSTVESDSFHVYIRSGMIEVTWLWHVVLWVDKAYSHILGANSLRENKVKRAVLLEPCPRELNPCNQLHWGESLLVLIEKNDVSNVGLWGWSNLLFNNLWERTFKRHLFDLLASIALVYSCDNCG